jgi:hypothetical protein
MKSLGERGAMNVLLIPLILAVVAFFGAFGFGIWAYSEMMNYKNNTDEIAKGRVETAIKETETKKDNQFLEDEKKPLREYKGPDTLGNIVFSYPKTWSGSEKESSTEMQLLMYPAIVPEDQKSTAYALRVEVVNDPYDKTVSSLETSVKSGKLTANPIRLKQMQNVLGMRFDGELKNSKQGSVVILPLRDKSIRITTESKDFVGDFNSIILENFTFSP